MSRLGEANTPGPCGEGSASLAFDQVRWALDTKEGNDLIGVCNPSGIANKHETFCSFPQGWWGVAETQASAFQLTSFRKALKFRSSMEGKCRMVSGTAAPTRSGSSTSGAWTGVLQFGDFIFSASFFSYE